MKDERAPRSRIGTTTFKVQEFEPDRMKVQLELTTAPLAGWLRPDEVQARVTVAHLFGAPAAGRRRVEGELSLTPVLPRFTQYPDYRFQIGEVLKEPHHETLAALTTDADGTAEFTLDLKRFVGRAYRLNVLGRAFEAAGGRNVAAQNSAIVSDAALLVGVKPDGDLTFVQRGSARQAHWLAVNQQLNPVAADELSLEWVQQKFVSVLTQQQNGTLKYVSRLKETVRSTRTRQHCAGRHLVCAADDRARRFRAGAARRDRREDELARLHRGRRSEHLAVAGPRRRAADSTRQGRPIAAATRWRSASARRTRARA